MLHKPQTLVSNRKASSTMQYIMAKGMVCLYANEQQFSKRYPLCILCVVDLWLIALSITHEKQQLTEIPR